MDFDLSDFLEDSMEIDDITNELYNDDSDDDEFDEDDYDIDDDDYDVDGSADEMTDDENSDVYFINSIFCTACGDCEFECPEGAIYEDDETYSINTDFCSGCGICKEICQESAIEIL